MASTAADLIPARGGVKGLREAAAGCRACPLWRNATETVFGAGPARAPVMLVGEQPRDREARREAFDELVADLHVIADAAR